MFTLLAYKMILTTFEKEVMCHTANFENSNQKAFNGCTQSILVN